ncbi:Ankyrin repeat and SAM domain-containing protein 3 [Halotydeus destructor]|nr:Ankyrin repeat and SAM domain-containing protein 3 [Halotydeus destructor]
MEQVSNMYSDLLTAEPPTIDLLTAASLGNQWIVLSMLQGDNCDPNLTNDSGWTAAMYAAHYGHFSVLRTLVDCGANVDLKEWEQGRTALMMAASNGHTRCIEVLVVHGKVDITVRDKDGRDAAHYARVSGHGKNKIIIKFLNIVDTRTRRIVRSPQPLPAITVDQHSGRNDNLQRSSRAASSELKATAVPFTPSTPTAYLSPFHYPSYFQNLSKAPSMTSSVSSVSPVTMTPDNTSRQGTPVRSSSINRRKRKLILSPSSFELDSVNEQDAEPSSKFSSSPLPANLDQLLNRIGLDMYRDLFVNNGVDLWVFMTLSEADFTQLGVSLLGHRRKMVLAQLRYRDSVGVTSLQESIYCDYLLNQLSELNAENQKLTTDNVQLRMAVHDLRQTVHAESSHGSPLSEE